MGFTIINSLQTGLSIAVVGIASVFINLLLLMTVIMVLGRLFGKKPKKKNTPPQGGPIAPSSGAGASCV